MIEPSLRPITLPDGESTKDFTIHKFDALSGREIVTQYPTSGVPKLGDYKTNEAIMLQMMCFVTVQVGEVEIPLKTKELVKNHVPDWETLMRLEWEIMEYNCSFFANGKASNFLDVLRAALQEWTLSMLTASSQPSSQKDKPLSES